MLHSVSVLVLHNSSFLVFFFFGLLTYPFDRSIVWSAFVLRVFVVRRFSFVILLLLVRRSSFVVRCLSFVFRSFLFVRPLVL